MTEAGYDNSLTGNTSLNAETADSARQAIQLLETGKVTKVVPFKTSRSRAAFLLRARLNGKRRKPAEAAVAFLKAVKSDSPYTRILWPSIVWGSRFTKAS